MAKRLKKELGLLDVFAISTGAMISSGFFLLPGIAVAKAGPAAILSYIISGIMIIPALFSMAELATAMPRSGGTYFFISRSLGSMFGTIDGVGDWLAMLFKSSIALIGIGAYLSIYTSVDPIIISLVSLGLFTLVNAIGAKETSLLQITMVVGLLSLLGIFIFKGLPEVNRVNFSNFMPHGFGSILPTTGVLFVSYIGLTKVASVSEEVRKPGINIPFGMILSLFTVILVYSLGVYIIIGVIPQSELIQSYTPVADAANVIMGPIGALIITIAAVLAFATTGNAGILSASRYILAMGRDHTIPHIFSRISKYKTPKYALAITVVCIFAIILLFDVENIAKLASAFQVLVFAMINIAVIVMRESGLKSYDPIFKSPLYPFTQIAGILVAVVLIPEMGILATIFSSVIIGLGVVWYHLYVKKRDTRVGAVGKMAERIAEKLLVKDAHALGLDRELRQILKEKGLRRNDPFVKTVLEAEFLEVPPKRNVEDVLRHAAIGLGKRSGISPDLILGALLERSRIGETPAEAGIALPHLLVDEIDQFYLVIARSIRGLDFPMSDQSIHAVFILLGSRKDPARHLRFLAEIARRAENPNFIDRWIQADNFDSLVEILLADPDSE